MKGLAQGVVGVLLSGMALAAAAKSADPKSALPAAPATPSLGARVDQPFTKGWQVGVEIEPVGGPCHNVTCTVPVPMDWEEQTVRIVEEDRSNCQVSYRTLEGGVQQLLVTIKHLNAKAHAKVTLEVVTRALLPPEDTSIFRIPMRRQVSKDVQKHLKSGSHVEVRHPLVRKALAEIVDKDASAWDQVKAIYDHVRQKVRYQEGPLKGGVQALRDGHGDCESMTCLFLALCRAHQVPARMVWVVDHAYPEFFLVDSENKGYWLPCQIAGTEAFGAMPDPRPILQKGEDFLVPDQKGKQFYVAEHLTCTPGRGSGEPRVEFIRKYVDLSGRSAEPTEATPDSQ